MEIAFHCPNCLADLIFDESKKYTCCFCHTTLTGKDEVRELEGGYYVPGMRICIININVKIVTASLS